MPSNGSDLTTFDSDSSSGSVAIAGPNNWQPKIFPGYVDIGNVNTYEASVNPPDTGVNVLCVEEW